MGSDKEKAYPEQYRPGEDASEVERLLGWQKAITRTLLGLLDESLDEKVVQDLLVLMLDRFGASRTSIFVFDADKRFFSCADEAAAPGVPPMKENLQHIAVEGRRWARDLLDGQMVFFPGNRGALLAAPLISKRNVWGFVEVRDQDRQRVWDERDRESFRDLVNVMGVGLALSHSRKEAMRNNEFLNKLYQNMPLGYFRLRIDITPEGRVTDYEYVDVNAKFLEIMGVERDRIVGKMHTQIGPIFVNKLDLQVLYQVAYQGIVYESKANRFRSNGRYYDVTIYSPQYGYIVALFSDVTEAVLSADALRQSEQELKKVYTNIPVGIEVYDRDGYMVDVNQKDLEITGVPDRGRLLGRNLFDHPSLPAWACEQLRGGKDATFDVSIDSMRVNRTYYGLEPREGLLYLTLKCNVLYDAEGRVEGYLAIVIDNTALYETSARLREFETVFNSVAQVAEVGFFRWNPLTKTYFNSDQWYTNMGLPKDEQGTLAFDEYRALIHPDDVGTLEGFLQEAVGGKTTAMTAEFRIRAGQGWKWLRTAAQVTQYEPDNNIVQITGINYNISELKLTEQNLIEAKSRAEESDRLKSAFLANMSHEIRTPLNAIVGFSSILAHTDDEQEKQQYVSIIEKNNDHLLGLISDVLDLSRIEAGTMTVTEERIHPYAICRQVVDSLQIKAPDGVGLSFTGSETARGTVMRTDQKLLIQVLSNLVSNALKFTTEGHVWLQCKPLGGQVEFSVEDTGIGMTEEQAARVFERFVKHNEFIPGTGLGLSICRSIVEKLGGRIGVESEPGKGSRFWFTLPVGV